MGQGPNALAVGVRERCLDLFTPIYHFSFLFPSLGETEIQSQRLKYSLKGPFHPTNQANVLDLIKYVHNDRALCVQ